MLTRYRNHLIATGRAESTVRRRIDHIRQLRARHNGELLALTIDDLEADLAAHCLLESETRKSMLSSWRVFYKWARRRGLIITDPAADLDPIRIHIRVPRIADDDRLSAALVDANDHDRAAILLGRGACLRLTEFTTLHTRNREGRWLRIIGKGNKERLVYLNDDVYDALLVLERQQGPGYYFPGVTVPHVHVTNMSKRIRDLTGYNPHALRHAGATAAYLETLDLKGVQEMLGHASMATTQRYLHLAEDSLRRVGQATMLRPAAERLAPVIPLRPSRPAAA